MKLFRCIFCLFVLPLTLLSQTGGSNMVKNGSFEHANIGNKLYLAQSSASQDLSNWVVEGGIDIISTRTGVAAAAKGRKTRLKFIGNISGNAGSFLDNVRVRVKP